MPGLNRVQLAGRAAVLYEGGLSTRQIAEQFRCPISRVRQLLVTQGVRFRSLREAAALKDWTAVGGRSVPRGPYGEARRAAISRGRKRWAETHSRGVRLSSSGYLEYTRGPHSGRRVHVVLLEKHIGRRITQDEQVHHKDHDKTNNALENLQLMTRADHARLHRLEDGDSRRRDELGRYI